MAALSNQARRHDVSANDPLRDLLVRGAEALGVALDDVRVERLIAYLALLAKWNATYNLTAIRDPREMVVKHVLDSLALVPHLEGATLADLGSGAGLPGLVVAIATPARRVWSVESAGKKARFQREVVRQLGLDNVTVVEGRAEAAGATPCDEVTARALASLPDLAGLARGWLAPGGRLLALKGPGHEDEVAGLPPGWRVAATRPLVVPGLDAARWLVVLSAA